MTSALNTIAEISVLSIPALIFARMLFLLAFRPYEVCVHSPLIDGRNSPTHSVGTQSQPISDNLEERQYVLFNVNEDSSPRVITSGAGPSLICENLTKRYGKGLEISQVSVDVCPGEIVALLGSSGSGKTTVLETIFGLESADGGTVRFNGLDISSLRLERRAKLGVAYVPQRPSVFRGLTVEENILSVLEQSDLDLKKRKIRLDQLLAEFKLDHLRMAKSEHLSGSERRLLEVARCVAVEPRYMLLDEPFSGVGPAHRMDLERAIQGLKERGVGVLLADQNLRETLDLVDRAFILQDGRVVASGTARELTERESVKRFFPDTDTA